MYNLLFHPVTHSIVVVVVWCMTAAICMTAPILPPDQFYQHEFHQYTINYNKHYATLQQHNAAYKHYIDNVHIINTINNHTHSWTAGINQYTDLSPDEFRQQYLMSNKLNAAQFSRLLQTPTNKLYNLRQYNTTNPLRDTPIEYDWRNYTLHRVVTDIVNQGAIGSCYAFSALDTISAQHSLLYNIDTIALSAEQIIDCSAEYDTVHKHANCGVYGGW